MLTTTSLCEAGAEELPSLSIELLEPLGVVLVAEWLFA